MRHFKEAILANLCCGVKKLFRFGLFFEEFIGKVRVEDPKNARYLVFIIESDLITVLRHGEDGYFVDWLDFFKDSLTIKLLVFYNEFIGNLAELIDWFLLKTSETTGRGSRLFLEINQKLAVIFLVWYFDHRLAGVLLKKTGRNRTAFLLVVGIDDLKTSSPKEVELLILADFEVQNQFLYLELPITYQLHVFDQILNQVSQNLRRSRAKCVLK